MTSNLRFALIGCGALGRLHAACVSGIEDAEFVAYLDNDSQASSSCRAEFGGDYATSDASRVFQDDSIDAVYICTRHDSHAALAVAAARSGKHILIEKPLALTAADCEAIALAVQASGVTLMPAFKMRYYPLVRQAHAFIPQPQVLAGQMMDTRWPDEIWAQDPVQGGGNIASQGCHTADLLRYLSGSEVQRLWAAGDSLTHPGHPCLDQCVASIQWRNGHIASWVQGDAALGAYTGKIFLQLFGAGPNGEPGRSVQLYDRLKKAVFSDGESTWTEARPEEEGLLLENLEFISALREGRRPEIDVHDGIRATSLVLAAQRAVTSGRVQEFS